MRTHQHPVTDQTGYIWQARPVNIWVCVKPHHPLQETLLQQLRQRFEARGCIFVEQPDQPTELGPVAHLGITFGQDLEQEISPFDSFGLMPKPRGTMLAITTTERIPEDEPLFDFGRGQLLKKSGHIGIVAEGDLSGSHIKRALWISMPGNNFLLTGDEGDILDNLSLRVLAHVSAEKVNHHDGDTVADFTWAQWAASPVHTDIAHAAHELGKAGLIENEIPLMNYGSGDQVRRVLNILKRAALGEGMRSQIDLDLQVMGVTTSGGNKIEVSSDPADGHVIPVRYLTWEGYLRNIPADCPISYVTPSVETHENGLVYLASALVQAGVVNNFDGFLTYLHKQFAANDQIDILPDGLPPTITAIDHFHHQPIPGSIKEPERVEIVTPSTSRFPEIDFPCGVREAGLHLLSAVFHSSLFMAREPLGSRAIIVVLPGHGSVALYGGPRNELTDLLVRGMEMEEIIRI